MSNAWETSCPDDKVQVHVHNFRDIFKDFFENSSVHGIRYFMESRRHWLERVWWMAAFIFAFALCSVSIMNIWSKWTQNPVVVTIDVRPTSIEDIPFPAFTICTSQKFGERNVHAELLDRMFGNEKLNFSSMPPTAVAQFDAIVQICFVKSLLFHGVQIEKNYSLCKTIGEIAPKQYSLMLALWNNDFTKEIILQPIFTEEGFCYTFNSLNSHNIYSDGITSELLTVYVPTRKAAQWNAEDGYHSTENGSTIYPFRVRGATVKDSLQFLPAIPLYDMTEVCYKAKGFRLLFHMPDELARFSENFINIPTEREVFISIKPKMIKTSNILHNYDPHVRGCYFKHEHRLRFFKEYSQSKCKSECLANYTNEMCGCVRFFLPRGTHTKVCTMIDMDCFTMAEDQFTNEAIDQQCDCLPDCNAIKYDYEMSQTEYHQTVKGEDSRYDDVVSKILISFKDQHFNSLVRSGTSTMSDFISSCGGLLGLFMGVSVLSIVELIYYFTLRLFFNWAQKKKVHSVTQTWSAHNNRFIVDNIRPKKVKRRFKFKV